MAQGMAHFWYKVHTYSRGVMIPTLLIWRFMAEIQTNNTHHTNKEGDTDNCAPETSFQQP